MEESTDVRPLQRAHRIGTLKMSAVSTVGPSSAAPRRGFVGDAMDRYLATLGLVKKMMPNDGGSSIYRAVCEGLSGSQCEYLGLQEVVESHLQLMYRLQRHRNGLCTVNKIEDTLKTIARLLRIIIHVYRAIGREPDVYQGLKLTTYRPNKVVLCESARGRFDLVYSYEDHINLACAQSILYHMLYVDTFKNSPEVIKECIAHVRADMDSVGGDIQTPSSSRPSQFSYPTSPSPAQHSVGNWRPPIPYSAVKALDPSVYRNIAYDLYTKDKRQQLEQIGIDRFEAGTHCFFLRAEVLHKAFVLTVLDEENRLIIVDGKKRKVRVSDLVPFTHSWSPVSNMIANGCVGEHDSASSSPIDDAGTVMAISPTVWTPAYFFTFPSGYSLYEDTTAQYVQPAITNYPSFSLPTITEDQGNGSREGPMLMQPTFTRSATAP
ncbi:unnamed protein product [Cylicocyclus nassatus]|uniref:Uncharacterized protein n=1 Tax=Cylicocyclus nassatus TaxID=53992 RepID=A0AA36GWR6_CYLNA|nr:unnamed protein product [Cylicocyclus nassatus]